MKNFDSTPFTIAARNVFIAIDRFKTIFTGDFSERTEQRRARELYLCVNNLSPIVMNTPKKQRAIYLETLEYLVENILKVPSIEMIIRRGCVCSMPRNAIKAARSLDCLCSYVARKTPTTFYRADSGFPPKARGELLRESVRTAVRKAPPKKYEVRLRRIDVTWRGQTERYFAVRSDDPKWWILYTPEDWSDFGSADWKLYEGPKKFDGDNGERIYFQDQPLEPMPGANWKWIDPAPTPDAYKELREIYRENQGEYPDDF